MTDEATSTSGLLLVVSGPSASGKSTLVEKIVGSGEFPIRFSVSATSRDPRPGEVPGKDYIFVSRETFLEMRERGEFLESAEVYDRLYGTPRQPVEEAVARGEWVLLEIDIQGHAQVKQAWPEAISFFVRAGDLATYEERLRSRGTESDEQVALRIENIKAELGEARHYDYQIVNDCLEQAARTWRTLLAGIRARQSS